MMNTFQSALLQSMALNAGQTAIEYGKQSISYHDLLVQSNAITRELLRKGVQPGAVVAIQIKERVQFLQALIGCINAGACFAALDASQPLPRLKANIQDLQPEYLVTTREEQIITSGGMIVVYTEEITKDDVPVEYPVFNPEDSLYIYFTSGSTGIPKGIIGKNSSLLQFLQWEIAAFNLGKDIRVSQLISPYFDAFLRDVFVPLLTGGTICIPPQEEGWMTPENMVNWINDNSITMVHCVPSVFRLFNIPSLTSSHFSNLQYILLSGERIIPWELEPWFQRFGDRIQLVNLYGATESTMIRFCYRIRPQDAAAARIPVGKPISDTELLLLNAESRPVKKLMPGEVYIVSDHIAKGYLNNPLLTEQKFVTLPDGRRAFRTGDKGRLLADGNLDLMGREDRQLKLNGIRIEPDEIENILLKSGQVKNALVFMHAGTSGNQSLVAFVTGLDTLFSATSPEETLQQYIKEHLPAYMIPSRIVVVEEFPLLPNGKIDQRGLVEKMTTVQFVEPANKIEQKLLAIWKELLGDKPISTNETFPSLGGNSISIMRLIGRIYNELNVRVSLNELFNNLTIQKQAAFIGDKDTDHLLVITKAPLKQSYTLSSAQQRVFYEYEMEPLSTAYNLPMTWEIKRNYDKQKIENALKQLVQRHESLRTGFMMEEDKPVQVVHETADLTLEEIDTTDDTINEAIYKFIQPFTLSKPPLLRAAVITTPSNRRILVADIHHIICDGMTQSILLSDFAALYEGASLTPLEIHYKDYAEWEQQFRLTDAYLSYRQFWLQPFEKDIPALSLPITHEFSNTFSEKGGNVLFDIPKASLRDMLSFMREKDITTFSGLFSLYYLFMLRISGQDDIVIGTVSAGRTQREVERVAGMFVKTLPIRQHIDTTLPCATFISNLSDYMVRATNAQAYDLSDMIIELNKNRAVALTRLFDVLFVFQNYETGTTERETDDIGKYVFENSDSKYPVTLFAEEKEDLFTFRWEYSGSFFTREDSEWLVSQFKAMAVQVSEDLFSPILEATGSNMVSSQLIEDDITFNF
jgi:mycobactin peptide synthetase MbtE